MKPTPELEAIMGATTLSQCKIESLVKLLCQKNVLASSEEIENASQEPWESEYESRRQKLIDGMNNPDIPAIDDF